MADLNDRLFFTVQRLRLGLWRAEQALRRLTGEANK